jgi:hypothetical protein
VKCQRSQDHAQDDTGGFLIQHQTWTHRREPSRIPVRMLLPEHTHACIHIAFDRHPSPTRQCRTSQKRPQPGIQHIYTKRISNICQLAASAIGALPRTRVPETKNPATTIPVFPNHLHVSAQARSREQAGIRGSLLEDPWSPCGTARDKRRDFRGGTTRVCRYLGLRRFLFHGLLL